MGLADQTIEPEVAEPAAADVPLDGELALVLVLLVLLVLLGLLLLLLLLLLQPATPSAPTTPTRAVSCQPFRGRLPRWLIDLARIMRPPLLSSYFVTSCKSIYGIAAGYSPAGPWRSAFRISSGLQV
jgi:hypothetical protein